MIHCLSLLLLRESFIQNIRYIIILKFKIQSNIFHHYTMHRFLHHEQPQPYDGKGLQTSLCKVGERERRLKPRLNCQRRKEGFATVSQQSSQPAPSSSALQSKSSQEITAGSSLCCPTTGSLGPKFLRTAANHRSKVKGEEKPLWSALDPSSVERGQERSLWEPARLLYDVKSSWSAAAPAGGLLHNQPAECGIISSSSKLPAPPFPRWGFQA